MKRALQIEKKHTNPDLSLGYAMHAKTGGKVAFAAHLAVDYAAATAI